MVKIKRREEKEKRIDTNSYSFIMNSYPFLCKNAYNIIEYKRKRERERKRKKERERNEWKREERREKSHFQST